MVGSNPAYYVIVVFKVGAGSFTYAITYVHSGGTWSLNDFVPGGIPAVFTPCKLTLSVNTLTNHLYLSHNGVQLLDLDYSPAGTGGIGTVATYVSVPSSTIPYLYIDYIEFAKTTLQTPPIVTISDPKYVTVGMAINAARASITGLQTEKGFTVDLNPTCFEDSAIDIGSMITVTEPAEIAGTYRIKELTYTDTALSITAGITQEKFTSNVQSMSAWQGVTGSYMLGATMASPLPCIDAPLYRTANDTFYKYLSFRVPKNMSVINILTLFWYLTYMQVDEQWTVGNNATEPNTGVTVEISKNDGGTWTAATGSPFTGNQSSVSILDVVGAGSSDSRILVRFSLSAAGEARIYGGGEMQGNVWSLS
jgi:hypothetical protein